jgi:hypothetical protein
MANEVTTYLEKAQIDFFLRPGATAPTRPTSVKVGLLTAITDAEAGTVTEASYTGYAAQDCGFGASSNNGGLERTSNAAQIDFPAVADGALAVVGYGIKDHLGNWLVVKSITTVNFNIGDIPRINAGALTHDQG